MASDTKKPSIEQLIEYGEAFATSNDIMLLEVAAILDRALAEIETVLKDCLPRGHNNATQAMNEAWTLSDLLLQHRNNIAASLLILNPPAEAEPGER